MKLAEKKNITADDSFKSVDSYSSSVNSFMTCRGGLFITATIMSTAIANKTKKLMSKLLSLAASHTTMYSNSSSSCYPILTLTRTVS